MAAVPATIVPIAAAPAADSARVVVDLPADAKLFIDDQPTAQKTGQRNFTTPKLEAGQAYYYELKAEVVRDGKTYTETQTVKFQAGQTAKASFERLAKAGTPSGPPAVAAR